MNDRDRLNRACHAMQAGVRMESHRSMNTENVHSRVGINSAMCEHAALVELLAAKGIITDAEYFKAAADEMENEVKRYEARLSTDNLKVTLHGAFGSIHDDEVTS